MALKFHIKNISFSRKTKIYNKIRNKSKNRSKNKKPNLDLNKTILSQVKEKSKIIK